MWFRRLIAGLICMAALAFSAYAISVLFGPGGVDARYVPRRTVSLVESAGNGAEEGRASLDGTKIRVAVAPVLSPEKSLPLYQDIVDFIGNAMGRKAVLVQRTSYSDVNTLLRHGGCEIGFVCAYPFVQGERDFGLKLLAVPVVEGKTSYQSFIIVPAGSPASSLMDLKGKRFASGDILSNSGWLFPATWLIRKGQDPRNFFREHVLTGSHDKSVAAVASSYVDGAAVHDLVYKRMVEADPSLAERARVIMKSGDFGMPPVVASPKTDPEIRSKLLQVLIHMHETSEGRAALEKVGIDRFVVPSEGLFDSVREAARLWESRR